MQSNRFAFSQSKPILLRPPRPMCLFGPAITSKAGQKRRRLMSLFCTPGPARLHQSLPNSYAKGASLFCSNRRSRDITRPTEYQRHLPDRLSTANSIRPIASHCVPLRLLQHQQIQSHQLKNERQLSASRFHSRIKRAECDVDNVLLWTFPRKIREDFNTRSMFRPSKNAPCNTIQWIDLVCHACFLEISSLRANFLSKSQQVIPPLGSSMQTPHAAREFPQAFSNPYRLGFRGRVPIFGARRVQCPSCEQVAAA